MYKNRLSVVLKVLGVANSVRDADFLRAMAISGIKTREWGAKSETPIKPSDIACIRSVDKG